MGWSIVYADQPATLPAWVSALALWQWTEIPNTALSSVAPSPTPGGITGPSAKITTWNGATLKRSGSVYMLGAAGGHGDYFGNEVNALTLNTETPAWTQLRAPSASADVVNTPAQFYLDERPSSTHTYWATQFIDSLNRMFVFPSAGVNSDSLPDPPADWYEGDKRSFVYSVAGGDWESPDYVPQYPGTGDFVACLCAKHPVTGDVYYSRNYSDGFYRFNASSKDWTKLSTLTRGPWYAGAAVDPVRDRILVVGSFGGSDAPEVVSTAGASVSASFSGDSLAFGGYPGVVYDEENDRFLVFRNSSPIDVYRVNPSTWAVDMPTVTGTKPAQRSNGIQNSVQYVPELRGVVMANSYTGNVKFMRTAA